MKTTHFEISNFGIPKAELKFTKFQEFVEFSCFFASICQRVFVIELKISDFEYFSLAISWKTLFFHWFQKSILRLFCHIDHGCKGYPLWIPDFGDTKIWAHLQLRLKKMTSKIGYVIQRYILYHFFSVSSPQTSIIWPPKSGFEIILMIKNEKMRFFSMISKARFILGTFFWSKYRE